MSDKRSDIKKRLTNGTLILLLAYIVSDPTQRDSIDFLWLFVAAAYVYFGVRWYVLGKEV